MNNFRRRRSISENNLVHIFIPLPTIPEPTNLNNISPTQFSQYSSSGHSSTNDLTNSLQSLQLHRNSNTSLNNLMPNNNFRNNQSTPNRSQTGPIIGYTSQNSSFNSQNSTNSITRPSMMPPLLTTATSTGNLRSQSSTTGC